MITLEEILAVIDHYKRTCQCDGAWDNDMTKEEVEQYTIDDVRSVIYAAFKDRK